MNRSRTVLVLAAWLSISAAATAQEATETTPPVGTTAIDAAATLTATTEVLASMDKSADPCQDFYRYACGGWLETTQLPADETRYARSFSVIARRNREIVRELLETAAKDPGESGERRQIGLFYGSCMDESAIDKKGRAPLEKVFAKIETAQDHAALWSLAGELRRQNVEAFFGLGVFPDFKNPGVSIALVAQGGLGMPDRDYYTSADPKKRDLLGRYKLHVARMLALAGEPAGAAASHASQIVALETELARVSRPRIEMRNVEKLYNKIDLEGLQKLTPGLPWPKLFAAAGYPDTREINVATPEFFEALERTLAQTDLETLQAYLRWHSVLALADTLPATFVDAQFEFYGKALAGQQEIEPRWRRCVEATQEALGEAVGKLYVEEHFPGTSKQVALEMIGDVEAAFRGALPALAWMDETTRQRALEKMEAIAHKIGYPDVWRDYSSLGVVAGDYAANREAAAAFEFDRQMRKIGQPVDRGEWGMTPQMVNAYYNPLLNEIAFPAGILQPPFFHRDHPAAMNYGGIGAVVGHELSHGFDDQGRKFDPQGNLREWWEPAVAAKFEHQAQCVRDQYSRYEIEPGVAVQGQLTLGENIADIGGLKQAFRAYQLWKERNGQPAPVVPGLSDEQLFFVAFGQVWCALTTPEVARLRVTVDPHSPPRFRAIGAIANHPDFGRVFGCKASSPMVPENRCEVW